MNKYNLNYYETMENANEYLDMIEYNLETMKNELVDSPEELEKVLTLLQEDHETILQLTDMLYMYLEQNDYQHVCNQLDINDMFNIIIKDALPERDLGYLSNYLEEMSEEKLIEETTRFIEKYYNY